MIRPNHNQFEEEDWRERAACRGIDPNEFFPFAERDQVEIAARACGTCAVQAECLNYALETRQEHGVWGGATEKERKLMLKAYVRNRKHA